MSPPCVSERRNSLRKSFGAFVAFLTLAMGVWLWPLQADEWMAIYDLLFGDDRNIVADDSSYRFKSREYVFDISNLDLSEFEKPDPHLVLMSDATGFAADDPNSGFAPDIGPLVGYGPGGVIPAGSPNRMGGNLNQFGDGDGGSGDGGGFPGGRRGGSPGFPFSPFFTNGGPPGSGGNPENIGNDPKPEDPGGNTPGNNPNNNPQFIGDEGKPDPNKSTNKIYEDLPGEGTNGPTGPIVALLVVPEPASSMTFGVGLAWLALLAYRRQTKTRSNRIKNVCA